MSKEETQTEEPKSEEEKKKFEGKKIEEPQSIEQKPMGIRDQLKDISDKMNLIADTKGYKLKKKGFKIPGKVKSATRNLKKLAEKGKIQVLLLKLDGSIMLTIGVMQSGMLMVGDYIHNGQGNIIWRWNGKIPTAIVPEWDLQPVTIDTLTKTTEELKSFIFPEKIIIRAMELKEALQTSKAPSAKAIIWIVIILGVAGYILFSTSGG